MALVLRDLQIVVDRLPLIGQVVGPEGKAPAVAKDGAGRKEDQGDQALLPLGFRAEKIDKPDGQQDAGEKQERHRRAHRRDGHKGRQKRPQDAPDGVERPQGADGLAAVLQAVHAVFDQRGRHRPQQEQGEDEEDHAGAEGRNDKKIRVDGQDQEAGDAQDDILPHHGDGGDPDGSHQNAAVEAIGVGVLVCRAAAPEIPQGHGDHDGANDDGPDDLGGTEIRGQQTAGTQLHRHDGDPGKELREIEVILIF